MFLVSSEQATQNQGKSKKQRQRNRPRNKRNRVKDNEIQTDILTLVDQEIMPQVKSPSSQDEKTREEIIAAREAKKISKLGKKQKSTLAAPSTEPGPAPASLTGTTIITEVEQTTITTKLTRTTTTSGCKKNVVEKQGAVAPTPIATVKSLPGIPGDESGVSEKSRDQIKAEREAKKAAKQAAKANKSTEKITQQLGEVTLDGANSVPGKATVKATSLATAPTEQKKPVTKAERRAVQEAQRAAKAQAQVQGKSSQSQGISLNASKSKLNTTSTPPRETELSPSKASSPSKSPQAIGNNTPKSEGRVKLFNHLLTADKDASLFINDAQVHPSIARLGVQYAQRTVVGSNARCIAFLHALRQVVNDFETPAKKEFGRSLDAAVKHHVDHLHKCRPLAVSVFNAYKQFKNQLTQLPTDKPETELKELLGHFIDTYIENQIGKAAQAISSFLQEKITDGDVLLTFGCSSLIHFICEEAKRRLVNFRVIVIDSRPNCEGQEMLRRLHVHGIPCSYVLINAVGYVMPEATKVLLGAHALLANGYVMARTGTAQVALVAHAHNVPVLVCCETHKFSERFQTDAIVYNELSDPNQLVRNEKCCLNNWQTNSRLTPLNLNYDITPPELVSAVVTEVAILPCTSVPVILRIKPDIGY
ncbi:translation initiation factor eIF-2B subunit delta isoform X1 [Drosophila willistoni]|uniref:translation initiation factor eIF-2B subunit delta isoform X1 n=2 Tax=Drosophila willistoni TaxID=7260 RepID=UPI000C26CD21|nr:translation initiation factor eIF-2B subunit delta isoform X1 [Drosophila willistoni]